MYRLTPTQIQKIIMQYNLAEAILDKAEEELEKATTKVRYLRRQRRLQAEKIAYIVYRGIETIDKLDRLEAEEAEAKRIYIVEQSAKVIHRGFPNISGNIRDQEAWLYAKGKVNIFNQSSIANNVDDQSTFLDISSVGRDIAVGGLSKS